MAYTQPILDGYTYPVAPVKNVNPPVRGVAITETLTGRYYTDWSNDVSRLDVNQSWPVMPADMYLALVAKYNLGGPLSYTDTDGTVYTVIFNTLTFDSATPREDGFLNVTVKLLVVSSP